MAAFSDNSTAPASSFDLVVATDKASYTLPADSVVQITISNQSDRDVYLPMSERGPSSGPCRRVPHPRSRS
jgi:hypothetical protein